MKKEIEMKWQGGMAFNTVLDGHSITVDAPAEVGGNDSGPRPKALMLVALGGCTGMDVVSILKKMRVEVDEFSMRISGNLTEEHPKHFDGMKLIYSFKGKDLNEEKIRKAINLSMDQYCGVSAVYKKAMDFEYDVELIEV